MSNPALDSQVKTALRDDKTAEKFAEHIAELTAQIVNATFKFAQDVKSAYESIPRRRLGDKNFDEIDQAKLALDNIVYSRCPIPCRRVAYLNLVYDGGDARFS